jgi:hypothetical protein
MSFPCRLSTWPVLVVFSSFFGDLSGDLVADDPRLRFDLRGGGKVSVIVATRASMAACRQNDFGGTAANDDLFRCGLPECRQGGTEAMVVCQEGGDMARKHGGNGGTPETKLGHRVVPAACSVLAFMSELRQVSEAQLIEGLIRLGFDQLPASQRDAIAVLLRAKGQSIRDLRPLPGMVDSLDSVVPGQQGGAAGDPAVVRIDRIGQIARSAAAPVDRALESLGQRGQD